MPTEESTYWLGDLLVGSTLRARLLRWTLEGPGEFFYTQVATAFPSAGTNVNDQLDRLIDLGMLELLPNYVPGNRRVNYKRTNSPFGNR